MTALTSQVFSHTLPVLDALGWALVHSLWQGALAFALTLTMQRVVGDKNAALRTGLQLLLLLGIFIAFAATFVIGLLQHNAGTLSADYGFTQVFTPPDMQTAAPSLNAATQTMTTQLSWTRYVPLAGLIWCLGFMLMSVRYGLGFWQTQKLRRTGLTAVPQIWAQRLTTLARNSGVYKSIALHISSQIDAPLTFGFFKPVILVPAGFLTGLPANQVEAILLHELAHIRRHDYAINLFQTALKTIFFYHPAVHYISHQIDESREQACDDYAIAQSCDPMALINGLAALSLSVKPQSFAMNAVSEKTGDSMPLLTRLRRLSGQSAPAPRPLLLMPLVSFTLIFGMMLAAVSLTDLNAEASESPQDTELAGGLPVQDFTSPPAANPETFTDQFDPLSTEDPLKDLDIERHMHELQNMEFEYSSFEDLDPQTRARVQTAIDKAKAAHEQAKRQAEQSVEQAERTLERALAETERAEAQRERAMERSYARREATLEQTLERANRARGQALEQAEAAHERALEHTEHILERELGRTLEATVSNTINQAIEQALGANFDSAEFEREFEQEFFQQFHQDFDAALEFESPPSPPMPRQHEHFKKMLVQYLLKDGYIQNAKDTIQLTNNRTSWTVNGQTLDTDTDGRYCSLMENAGLSKADNNHIIIEGSNLSMHTHTSTAGLTLPVAAPSIPAAPIPPSARSTTPQFITPVPGARISSKYGVRSLEPHNHQGIDLAAPSGTPVMASAAGTVVFTRDNGNWGLTVMINHGNGYVTRYGHLDNFLVSEGQSVRTGTVIATVGTTGQTIGPHLHFEIKKNGQTVDPETMTSGL